MKCSARSFEAFRLLLALILAATLAVVHIALQAAEDEPEKQFVSIEVGDRFTIYTGGGAKVRIEDESILSSHQADAANLFIQGRRPGSTTLLLWPEGRSAPRHVEVTVSPRAEAADGGFIEDEPASVPVRRDAQPAVTRSPPASVRQHDDTMVLYVGAVATREVGGVARVVVGNDNVLKASTLDDGSLLLVGVGLGISELEIWTLDGRHIRQTVRVYQAPPSDPLQLINAILVEYPDVSAEENLGRIILRGSVDAARFEGFERIVTAVPSLINLVRPQINVAIEDGIALDVTVLEVNRNYQRNVGIRWQDTAAGPAAGIVGNLHRNRLFGVVSNVGNRQDLLDLLGSVGSGGQRLSGYLGITSIFGSEIQLLQEEGQARVLAAPTLTTVSGESAKFLAGGDLPVAILNEFGQPVVEFREFGIQLEIQPIADRHHNIRSRIRAEVSSVDFSVQVNGVPGLLRRQTASTITARPGETIILSGLLDARDTRAVDKVPALGSIPIIGALFRSNDFIQQRTELVITVTPRIQRANEPLSPNLKAAETHLRKILRGGERLDAQLLE